MGAPGRAGRGRGPAIAGALYAALVAAAVVCGAVAFRELYRLDAPSPESYRAFLGALGVGLGVALGAWTAFLGVRLRRPLPGLAALAAGAAVTALALSTLPWVRFPFDRYPASVSWLFEAWPAAAGAWVAVSLAGWVSVRRARGRPA